MNNIFLPLALALAQQLPADNPLFRTMITVPAASTNPDFWFKPVEVCGHVLKSKGKPNEALMYGSQQWIWVEEKGTPLTRGAAACLAGVLVRRDGLSKSEAQAKGVLYSDTTHVPNTHMILRRCEDRESCEALLPEEARLELEKLEASIYPKGWKPHCPLTSKC